jgi:hypothetical protein
MSLLPPDDGLELIHTRTYETKVYLVDDHLLARGAVCDTKRPGLYVEDDPDPLDIHRMVIELEVSVPDLTITAARTRFETFPNDVCPDITDAYEQLVGLSIVRGFTHKVRELFGGPRGCTHVMALLQALAPAVVQSTWSLNLLQRRAGRPSENDGVDPTTAKFAANVNTCHVWAEDGSHVASIRRGDRPGPPIPVRERLEVLGRDPSTWRAGTGD